MQAQNNSPALEGSEMDTPKAGLTFLSFALYAAVFLCLSGLMSPQSYVSSRKVL